MNNKLILGTVQFGLDYGINNHAGKLSEREAFEVLDVARSSGINELDTADAYGDAVAVLGRYLSQNPKAFKVNTKFKSDTIRKSASIAEHLQKTLELLQLHSIEVYFYHNFDELIKTPSTFGQLAKLKASSKINRIGVSVYTNEELREAIDFDEIDVIQLPFNALDNSKQRGEGLNLAKERNKIIQARSVFLQGLFFKDIDSFPGKLNPLKKYVSEFLSIVKDSGRSVEDICLSYVLSQPNIDQVIIGVDSKDQLQRNLTFAKTLLSEKISKRIDDIHVKEIELLYPKNWN